MKGILSKKGGFIVSASQARLGPCCFLHLQVKFEVGHVKQHSPTPLPPKQPPTSNPKQKPLPRRPNPEPPKPCKQNEHKKCRNIFQNILVLEESQWFPGVPDLGSDYSRCCRLSGDRYLEPILTQAKCLFTLQELILSW